MGVKSFVEGGISSIVADSSTHPLDLIKVQMQLQGEQAPPAMHLRPAGLVFHHHPAMSVAVNSHPQVKAAPISVGMKIVQMEGVTALFSGVSATVLRQTLYSTTRMGLYEVFKQKWSDPGTGSFPLSRKIAAGLLTGSIGTSVGNPADVAMVRMQADGRLLVSQHQNYKSVLDAITKMSPEEGVASLWRGSSLTVNSAMIVTASQLALYDQIKMVILDSGTMKDRLGTHVTVSFDAGVVASMALVASNPVDVIKTRVMNMRAEAGVKPPYSRAVDCGLKMIRSEEPCWVSPQNPNRFSI